MYNSTFPDKPRKPLKRTPFKSRTSPLKRSGKPLSRSTLAKLSKSPVAATKRRIQAFVRQIVILRDGGCILRHYGASGKCSGPLQGEHLISRANSATYGDTRNIVCLCQRHHIFWKPQNSLAYWSYIMDSLGKDRWSWVKLAQADAARPHKVDWLATELVLQAELTQLESGVQ